MDSNDSAALQRALLLEQAITAQLDDLIKAAVGATLLLDGNRDMEVGQLRNLLNASIESRGQVEVVVNYIRYQIARNERAWGRGFGNRVIADLRGTVDAMAAAAARQVADRLPTDAERGDLKPKAFARLMQLYLGYLHRSFYFARRVGSFDSLKEVGSGA